MDVILHYPSEESTETIENAASFETEWGDTNTVTVEQADGTLLEREGIGLTVAAGTESGD